MQALSGIKKFSKAIIRPFLGFFKEGYREL